MSSTTVSYRLAFLLDIFLKLFQLKPLSYFTLIGNYRGYSKLKKSLRSEFLDKFLEVTQKSQDLPQVSINIFSFRNQFKLTSFRENKFLFRIPSAN